jgi:two-component system, cell cycle sensor histidine kinase and response regulator CckA
LSARSEQYEKIAYGVFRDVTRRKIDQEKIEEQAALLNQTRDAVIVVMMTGEVIFSNNAAVGMYGWEAWEVLGKNIETLLFHIDDRHQYRACLEDVMHYGEWMGEQTHVVKSAKSITKKWKPSP